MEVRSGEVGARAFPSLPRKSMTYSRTALELLGSFDGGGGGAVINVNEDSRLKVILPLTTILLSLSLHAYPIPPQLRPHILRFQQRHLPTNSSSAVFPVRCQTRNRPSQFYARYSFHRQLLSHRRIEEHVTPCAEER